MRTSLREHHEHHEHLPSLPLAESSPIIGAVALWHFVLPASLPEIVSLIVIVLIVIVILSLPHALNTQFSK